MRKTLLFSLILSLTLLWLIACGSSKKPPVVQPVTSSVAFLQETPGQYWMFTPTLGKFSTINGVTSFSAAPVIDSSTNQPVSGEFWSIALSRAGDKATFDLYGGLDGTSNQWDIFVGKADGTGLSQITNDTNDDAMPQFSPDGTKVVFVSYRPSTSEGTTAQLVIRNIDGSGEKVLPISVGGWTMYDIWAPTFSPDGTKIAMQSWGYDANDNEFAGIVVMSADGSSGQLLTNPFISPTCYCWDETPSYSADGTKIAFAREDVTNSPATEDLYLMNTDGSNITKLTDSVGTNYDPLMFTLSGAGEKLLFSSNRDNSALSFSSGFEIYSAQKDGSAITRLTNNTLFDGFTADRYESGGESAAANARPFARVHQIRARAQHHTAGLNWGRK